jgi:hypothetical protein
MLGYATAFGTTLARPEIPPGSGLALVILALVGLAAGLHAALYGAYKDAPHENFLLRRFIRELVIAAVVTASLGCLHLADHQTPFVIYLSVFALARIMTEFWKLFLRVEPQEDYRIPTQIHCVTGVVHNPALRLLFGAGFLGGIYGCYRLFHLLPDSLPWASTGIIVGGGIGIAEALAGAYKDGTIEGFSFLKFLKSPAFGAVGGLIASFHTTNLAFLLFAAIGSMRMFNELLFKMLVRDYTPGKFRSLVGPYPEWMTRRTRFLPPYAATWLPYVVLFVRPY